MKARNEIHLSGGEAATESTHPHFSAAGLPSGSAKRSLHFQKMRRGGDLLREGNLLGTSLRTAFGKRAHGTIWGEGKEGVKYTQRLGYYPSKAETSTYCRLIRGGGREPLEPPWGIISLTTCLSGEAAFKAGVKEMSRVVV